MPGKGFSADTAEKSLGPNPMTELLHSAAVPATSGSVHSIEHPTGGATIVPGGVHAVTTSRRGSAGDEGFAPRTGTSAGGGTIGNGVG